MKKLGIFLICFTVFSFWGAGKESFSPTPEFTLPPVAVPASVPQPPPVPVANAAEVDGPDVPVALSITAIKLNSKIIPIGLTAEGALDVPSGSTKNVGWYKDGAAPGEVGSAVLDAHVFAAFAHLDRLTAGSNIYITMQNGAKLHFKVYAVRTYKNADVPLNTLFNKVDGRYLNLITCAGKLTADRSTYDHRLVIYSKLVED